MLKGGGGSSSQSGMQNLGTLDLPALGIANLFGGSIRSLPGGGVTLGQSPSFVLPSVFQPQDFQDLSTLTTPLNPVQMDLGQLGQFAQGAAGTLGEAAQTGLIDPARELFGDLFQERLGDISERFGQMGLNQNDSDFGRAAIREAQLGSTQLADLAQNRRLQASQALPGVFNDLLGFEGGARSAERARTTGGQQLDLLMSLAGINTQAGGIGSSRGRSMNFSKS